MRTTMVALLLALAAAPAWAKKKAPPPAPAEAVVTGTIPVLRVVGDQFFWLADKDSVARVLLTMIAERNQTIGALNERLASLQAENAVLKGALEAALSPPKSAKK